MLVIHRKQVIGSGKNLLNVHTQQDKNLFMRSITTTKEKNTVNIEHPRGDGE